MGVLEIIEQIQALPPSELEVVVAFVENLKTSTDAAPGQPASDGEFEDAANHVFQNYGDLLERLEN